MFSITGYTMPGPEMRLFSIFVLIVRTVFIRIMGQPVILKSYSIKNSINRFFPYRFHFF